MPYHKNMEISNLVCISSVEGVYQCWYFNVNDQQYSYTTHNPLTTRTKKIPAYTKLARVFDDGVTIEDVRLEQFLPLRKTSPEEDIRKFLKIAVIS
jgi:hypothetical protein